jgi:apolipoprotein N-acyltransferase
LKKRTFTSISLLSGLLLWAAWPLSPLTFLIFIAFVPLLFLADVVKHRVGFFVYAFITLLTWNAATTWWIWNSTDVGAIAAIITNSLLMTLPWWCYRVFNRLYGNRTGYIALVLFWMGFEYIHLNWQLSWPWLTLGNVFASHPNWVQWYEYTGTSGGSFWILVINLLFFEVLKLQRSF